jgi:hypothetical protein
MALPIINGWPSATIDGYKSEWNAVSLPLQYSILNTKAPVNTDDSTIPITSIIDDNGNAKIQRGSNDGEVAKEWIEIAGTTNYDGAQQILSVDVNNLTIDAPFVDNDTGTTLIYYNNYTSLIRVYAGIDPAHDHGATKPMVLIGTIEQRPDTDNTTLVDVRDYVKNKLNSKYDTSQASWPNDLNGWADFYISQAERYDLVTAGVVGDFTSAFTDDEADGGINYLKAVNGAQQFGYAYAGNMVEYLIRTSFAGAKWMTDFTQGGYSQSQNFDVSILIADAADLKSLVQAYDKNGNVIQIITASIGDEGYGVYRISVAGPFAGGTDYLTLTLEDSSGNALTEATRIDVFCPVILEHEPFFRLLEDGYMRLLENDISLRLIQ